MRREAGPLSTLATPIAALSACRGVSVLYGRAGTEVRALSGVDFAIAERETIVSQSGRRDGETPPQSEAVSATLGRLEFTHGYNLLTLNLVRGGGSENARMVPYAGAGLGIAVPHVEVQRAGAPRETRTYEYQIAGPAVQILAGVEWRFGRRRSVFVEYKLSCAAISGALTGGGTVGTKLCTHQFLAGPAVHVAARQPAR